MDWVAYLWGQYGCSSSSGWVWDLTYANAAVTSNLSKVGKDRGPKEQDARAWLQDPGRRPHPGNGSTRFGKMLSAAGRTYFGKNILPASGRTYFGKNILPASGKIYFSNNIITASGTKYFGKMLAASGRTYFGKKNCPHLAEKNLKYVNNLFWFGWFAERIKARVFQRPFSSSPGFDPQWQLILFQVKKRG